jgi:hypothetical protein
MAKAWTLLALLAACVPAPYRAGKLTESIDGVPYPNAARVGECLDFAAWWLPSQEVEPRVLVVVAFGNRCDHAVPIDLGRMTVEATYGELPPTPLTPFDPHRELHARRLAPHERGNERIAYFDPDTMGTIGPPRELCLRFPDSQRQVCVPRGPE